MLQLSPFTEKHGAPSFSTDFQRRIQRPIYTFKNWYQWPKRKSKSPLLIWRRSATTFHLCGSVMSKCQVFKLEEIDKRSVRDVETIDEERRKNQLINYQSERHCTLSGRFLGIGSAVTYLWGKNFWAFASVDDEASAPSDWARPWNLAKRLMTENFSRSWHSTLKSKIEALLSSLHNQKAEQKREKEKYFMYNKCEAEEMFIV